MRRLYGEFRAKGTSHCEKGRETNRGAVQRPGDREGAGEITQELRDEDVAPTVHYVSADDEDDADDHQLASPRGHCM